jgi:hypothetical protein
VQVPEALKLGRRRSSPTPKLDGHAHRLILGVSLSSLIVQSSIPQQVYNFRLAAHMPLNRKIFASTTHTDWPEQLDF